MPCCRPRLHLLPRPPVWEDRDKGCRYQATSNFQRIQSIFSFRFGLPIRADDLVIDFVHSMTASQLLQLALLLAAGSCCHGLPTLDFRTCPRDNSSALGGIICTITGPVALPNATLTTAATILGASSSAAVVLQPRSPLIVRSLTLRNLTVSGVRFSTVPLDPSASLAWNGIIFMTDDLYATLMVSSCTLVVDCITWANFTSAVCDHGRAPGDSQVGAPSMPFL